MVSQDSPTASQGFAKVISVVRHWPGNVFLLGTLNITWRCTCFFLPFLCVCACVSLLLPLKAWMLLRSFWKKSRKSPFGSCMMVKCWTNSYYIFWGLYFDVMRDLKLLANSSAFYKVGFVLLLALVPAGWNWKFLMNGNLTIKTRVKYIWILRCVEFN